MKYNEKRSLYESIMKDVAKIVKRRLNENSVEKDYIEYNNYHELRHYAQDIISWAIVAHQGEIEESLMDWVHAVNDNNLFIFVIKEEDHHQFNIWLSEEIMSAKDEGIIAKNLNGPLIKSALPEIDLFYMYNEVNIPTESGRAINTMMSLADGQFQDIRLDKKPCTIYVTTDEKILENLPLMNRVSKVFIQRCTERERLRE